MADFNKKACVSKWLKHSKQNFTLVSVNHLINDFRSLSQGYLAMFKHSNYAEANAIKISPGLRLLMFEHSTSWKQSQWNIRLTCFHGMTLTKNTINIKGICNDLSVWGHGFSTRYTGEVGIAAQQRMWTEHAVPTDWRGSHDRVR